MTLENRRHNYVMKDFLIPIAVAVVVGVGSSYMSTQVALSAIKVQIQRFQEDLVMLSSIVEAVQVNQNELAARGEWMKNTDRRLTYLERAVRNHDDSLDEIIATRYTPEDAEIRDQLIMLKIEAIMKQAQTIQSNDSGGEDE